MPTGDEQEPWYDNPNWMYEKEALKYFEYCTDADPSDPEFLDDFEDWRSDKDILIIGKDLTDEQCWERHHSQGTLPFD